MLCHNTASVSHKSRFKINVGQTAANQLSIFTRRGQPSRVEPNVGKEDDGPSEQDLNERFSFHEIKTGG